MNNSNYTEKREIFPASLVCGLESTQVCEVIFLQLMGLVVFKP